MGSSSSKFKKYLQNGDEYAAMQIFQSSTELDHGFDPNSSYGDSLKHNTPLHLAAKHAMKYLLRIFLTELNGDPNKQNAAGETPLHLVCQSNDSMHNIKMTERRISCLNLIVQWHCSNSNDTVHLDCVDNEGNSALHFAAASGMMRCVEILVTHGASLFIENKSSETVCDLAEKNKHEEIATYLETKMLFFSSFSENVETSTEETVEECKSGLREQDLQEAKDQLLVETSDMLHVPLFAAEVLLRNHDWSRQNLLDAWMKDPVACCKNVGITPPSSAINFSPTRNCLRACCEQIQKEYQNETLNSPIRSSSLSSPEKEDITCDICVTSLVFEDTMQVPCLHQFCKECWKQYLTDKINSGDAHNILCPAFDCSYVVPVDIIEKLVDEDMVKRYLQFDIKAFVESNPQIKWCPYPACARAVKVPEIEKISEEILALSYSNPPTFSHSVDCGNGHYFCWECLAEAHAPCGCEKWKDWHHKISEIKPQELKNTYMETEKAENCLWMVTNSKPCPNCKCPIQRNEGCNHMKCTKCKFEFCWVCLETWKKHSPATGGYFRCNRHDAVKKAELKNEALINEAETHNKHMQELKRFLQYYTRFKNHENSCKFEEPFLKSMQEKKKTLTSYILTTGKDVDLSFLEESIFELLRARRILCGAYVYGFYLEDNGYNKTIFEYLQNELEEATEKLSDCVARTFLQTPHFDITRQVGNVKKRRLDLLNTVHKGLIPPETPPSLRKLHRHRLPGLMGIDSDDYTSSQALLGSLENVDPNNPWVINSQGKHTNIAAVCDWPDYDSDEDLVNPILSSILGVCSRDGCDRPRAKNQRTGEIHEYCTLSCKHWKELKSSDFSKVTIDPALDALITLELSKLQAAAGTILTDERELSVENSDDNINAETFGTENNFSEINCNDRSNTCPTTMTFEAQEDIAMASTERNMAFSSLTEDIKESETSTMENSSVNFYLKDSNEDNRNINVLSADCLKIEKLLFNELERSIPSENICN